MHHSVSVLVIFTLMFINAAVLRISGLFKKIEICSF